MGKLYTTYVPDDGPLESPLWFIGESPGADEEFHRKPFIGESGQLLMDVLKAHGLSRNDVRLANLCKFRPYGNDFKNCIGTRELESSVKLLHEQISTFKPRVVVALGGYPLSYLSGKYGIERYRGSILSYGKAEGIKLIATRHPAAVLRDGKEYPIFDFDIGRCVEESKTREFNLPTYEFVIDPKGLDKEEWTARLCKHPGFLGTDIESIKATTTILCIGFAISASKAVIYPWNEHNIPHIQRILASDTEKVFHFGTYDTTMLEENGLKTNNYLHDTMAAQHILEPELPRSLAYLTSVYTRQFYYKAEGRATLPNEGKGWSAKTDMQKLYAYNGTDCCVTWSIADQQKQELAQKPQLIPLFEYEMEMIQIARSISRTGLLIDNDRRNLLRTFAIKKWRKRQGMFNFLAHFYNAEWLNDCNVNSPKMKILLYDDLKLPVKKHRDGKVTTDEDAIVELLNYVKTEKEKLTRPSAIQQWQEKETLLSTVIEIRGLRKLISSYLNPKISSDGRLRSTYKVTSVETARWACEKFVDKSGVNSQTFPREGLEIDQEEINISQVEPLTETELKDLLEAESEEENEVTD